MCIKHWKVDLEKRVDLAQNRFFKQESSENDGRSNVYDRLEFTFYLKLP